MEKLKVARTEFWTSFIPCSPITSLRTYGAGGTNVGKNSGKFWTTSRKTARPSPSVTHFTCIGNTKEDIKEKLQTYLLADHGIDYMLPCAAICLRAGPARTAIRTMPPSFCRVRPQGVLPYKRSPSRTRLARRPHPAAASRLTSPSRSRSRTTAPTTSSRSCAGIWTRSATGSRPSAMRASSCRSTWGTGVEFSTRLAPSTWPQPQRLASWTASSGEYHLQEPDLPEPFDKEPSGR